MSQSSPCLWTQLPQSSLSPCDRYKHACCSHDGTVYLYGGRESTSLRDFWKYSVVCDEWTELNCSSEAAPEELEEHSMVAHEGFLYVFGGMLDSAYTKWRCPLWVFDIAKHKWVRCQGKTIQSQRPVNRKGHSAVVIGSSMLVYGGFIDIKGSSQEFWSLDLDTMAWTLLTGFQQGSLGPGPRHSHSATAYRDCMYLYGGLKGLREQRDFWEWNSSSHVWNSLKTKSGPSKLIGHSTVVYKDAMFVFGGGESQNAPHNSLWRYSFSAQTWRQVAAHPGSNPPDKIHHCWAGLGPSYKPNTGPGSSSGLHSREPEDKTRPFKNKCFPTPLTFLGSEGAIELETFSPDKCHSNRIFTKPSDRNDGNDCWKERDTQRIVDCLTFENRAFRKQWSCTDEELNQEDIAQHLPDLLLVFGGRPYTRHSPIAVWQMTLAES